MTTQTKFGVDAGYERGVAWVSVERAGNGLPWSRQWHAHELWRYQSDIEASPCNETQQRILLMYFERMEAMRDAEYELLSRPRRLAIVLDRLSAWRWIWSILRGPWLWLILASVVLWVAAGWQLLEWAGALMRWIHEAA